MERTLTDTGPDAGPAARQVVRATGTTATVYGWD